MVPKILSKTTSAYCEQEIVTKLKLNLKIFIFKTFLQFKAISATHAALYPCDAMSSNLAHQQSAIF